MNYRRLRSMLGHAAIVLAPTFLFTLGYMLAVNLRAELVFWLYYAALGISTLAYVLYNRGFSRTRVSREELPDTWSEEEKDEFFADAARRRHRSRPLLYIVIALWLTFLYDMFFLFLAEPLSEIFPIPGDYL